MAQPLLYQYSTNGSQSRKQKTLTLEDTMKKITITISTLAAIALIAGAAFAWGPGSGRAAGYGPGNCPGYDAQGAASTLTQEQQDQLTELRQKYIDQTYKTRAAKVAKAQEVRLLMETSNPDRAKLVSLSNEILELDKALTEQQIDYQLAVKKIDPELTGFRGMGFGRGHGMWSSDRGQGRFHGQGRGCDNF